jgi:alanine racemase
MFHELTATIHRERLRHNVELLRRRTRPGTLLCAAVKADGYGHGAALVAPELERLGVEMAAVATIEEGIELRQHCWRREILILGNVLAVLHDGQRFERVHALLEYDLTPTITDAGPLNALAAGAELQGKNVRVHVKFDSGMGRQGVLPDDVYDLIVAMREYPRIRLAGIYSHFATADLGQQELAAHQLETFHRTLDRVDDLLPAGTARHIANTAAVLEWPETHFEMVRPGLGIYGYAPSPALRRRHDLQPILRLTSRVTLIKTLPAGHCVGYGQTFTTKRPTRVGIVPAGYADGFLRRLSNDAIVGTAAGDAPVIGRISMDQLTIDLTDLPSLGVGDEVVLIDPDPARPNSVESIAGRLETIPYEVTCLLGRRIDRIMP